VIRRTPAERYYKYLVIHPGCYDDQHIKDIAFELGLDYLGDWYIQWLRDRMRPPSPFHPEDETHTRSQQYLLREGLLKVFLPDKDMDKATRILSRPRWRELVETLILSRAPLPAIVHALRVRHSVVATEAAIRLYKYYYWDIDLLDSTEMRALLEMRYTGGLFTSSATPGADLSRLSQMPALEKSRYNDPRYAAARLPASPISAVIAQTNLGVMPKKVDVELVVSHTLAMASCRTLEAAYLGGPGGAQISQGFSAVAETMTRLKEAVVNPETNLREDLRRITVATTTVIVPTLRELTGGNHTVNIQPDAKPDADEIFEEDDDAIEGIDAAEFEDRDPADANS